MRTLLALVIAVIAMNERDQALALDLVAISVILLASKLIELSA